jgi:hypothetical protein
MHGRTSILCKPRVRVAVKNDFISGATVQEKPDCVAHRAGREKYSGFLAKKVAYLAF